MPWIAVRVRYLGKKGVLTERLKTLGTLPSDERPAAGQQINRIKSSLKQAIAEKKSGFEQSDLQHRLGREALDVTLPGRRQDLGSLHPVTHTRIRIREYFERFGFSVEEGPEVEDEFHNFEALNIPAHHPARAMHDTFLLRRRHAVAKRTPHRCRFATCNTTARRFASSHPAGCTAATRIRPTAPCFTRSRACWSMSTRPFAHLKSMLVKFLQTFFEDEALQVRFRPSYFPFTEPSAEIDVAIPGSEPGNLRWLEILGCGMVHPAVFEQVGIDPKRYRGYAFGMGVERLAMLRYQIDDLRLFFEKRSAFFSSSSHEAHDMQVSERWLREWVDPSTDTQQLAEALTMGRARGRQPLAGCPRVLKRRDRKKSRPSIRTTRTGNTMCARSTMAPARRSPWCARRTMFGPE